jgi:hypothetical protein
MGIDRSNTVPFIIAMMKTYSKVEHTELLRRYLHSVIQKNNIDMETKINNAKTLDELKGIGSKIVELLKRIYLFYLIEKYNIASPDMKKDIDNAKNLDELNVINNKIDETIKVIQEGGGRHREMNVKDIKELCKANQIKLSRVVDGKRVAYKKKELMTKLKRKKLL